MSRYLDLLKQIPPGKEEIPEVLLKQLNSAASSMISNRAGQYDLSEDDLRNYEYDQYDPDACSLPGRWGLLDRWPLQLGDLVIFRSTDPEFWYLEISSGSNPNLMLKYGSKEEILVEEERLSEYRKTEGEEGFEDEIMRLVDSYWDKADRNRDRK